jgi:hypothetical protein
MTEKASTNQREEPFSGEEQSQREQLRKDGCRSLAINLAEGLALSEFLASLPGGGKDLSAMEAREAFRRAQQDSMSGD